MTVKIPVEISLLRVSKRPKSITKTGTNLIDILSRLNWEAVVTTVAALLSLLRVVADHTEKRDMPLEIA